VQAEEVLEKADSRRAVRQLSWEAPQSRDLCSNVLAAYRCREDPNTEDGAIALEGLPVSYHRVHVQAKKRLDRRYFNRAASYLSWEEASHIAMYFAAACSLPFGFIKTQLQQMEPDPFSVLERASWQPHVFIHMCRPKNLAKAGVEQGGLQRGAIITLFWFPPFSDMRWHSRVSCFPAHAQAKEMLEKAGFQKGSQAVVLGGATIAGFFAAACSLPFDFVKTRIQKMEPNPDGTMPYKGPVDCALKTLREEGLLKFYTGFPTYCIRYCAPYIHPNSR